MTDNFDIEYLEEGDSFDGSPMEQSVFISAVLNAGGTVEIQGDKVNITSLPKKEASKAKAPASPKKEVPTKEATKVETPKKEAPKKEAPKVEPVKAKTVDPEIAIAPAPKAASVPTDAKE